ncbi:alpha/beta hydrolase [Flavobacterium sp. ASW18X]|uniref:alpha/beta hydrolase n=1 Tax=Flavobacterium sp. ASW18X TaxID=2572595 RepID=UPI0010ADB73F|nr:esterase [Flavobacterium sp. ASW18X]TKD66227.1 esterase [Flavobacterium sp. ASW18X]
MSTETRLVTYQHSNHYQTLNAYTTKTKNSWLVLHGIGYLSRYFLRHFNGLEQGQNYIVCPEAPSKYYLKDDYKYVGASWLTKEYTDREMQNVNSYLNAVWDKEKAKFISGSVFLGFSQGVSVLLRWMSKNKLEPQHLFLIAGSIPQELKPEDFNYLKNTKVTMIYGDEDQYITSKRAVLEKEKLYKLFGNTSTIKMFQGGHKMPENLLPSLI